jgi:hypothetical protein
MQQLCFGVPEWFPGERAPTPLAQALLPLGSGDAWPRYWRPFLIAAYAETDRLPPRVAAAVQRALLRCAPTERAPDASCCVAALQEHRAELELVDADAIADLALVYAQRAPIGPRLLRLAARQLAALRPLLPRCAEALPPPYAARAASHDLADARWDQLVAALGAWAALPLAEARIVE